MPDEGTDGILVPDDIGTVTVPRLYPSVCGAVEWPERVTDTNVDLTVAARAVASRQNTAAIVSMPVSGGDARGFVIDSRMAIVSDQSIATSYDQVGVSYAANRYAATTRHDGSIGVWMMADDLSSSDLLTTVTGTVLAKQTFLPIAGGLVMPVGDQYGVTLHRFADSYEPITSYRLAKTDAVEGLAAASSGTTALVAWTTNNHCFLGATDGLNMSATDAKYDACPNPRVAIDSASLSGVLAFDSPEGVRLSLTDGVAMLDRVLVSERATSPRVLFDGSNFWMSWIDERDQVIVGIVDTQARHVTSLAIVGPRPSASSYELAMVDGSPWVFTLDGNGYAGHRLCVAQR